MYGSYLCIGDINRFNGDYKCILPTVTSNAVAEQFFVMKKRNNKILWLLILDFIRKCWHDNKGLQRQFILGLKRYIEKRQNCYEKHEIIF